MSRLLSRYWLLVPLILAAIVVRNWIETSETLVPEEPLAIQALRADYYLEDFTTRRFDESGALEYLLRGDVLSHYPEDDRAEILAPTMELHRPDARWDGRADAGTFVRAPDVVTLTGDVVLERAARPATPASPPGASETVPDDAAPDASARGSLVVRADDLSVAVATNEISTAGPVEVTAPGWRLRAVGLQAAIDEGNLDLLSEVHGRYEVVTP